MTRPSPLSTSDVDDWLSEHDFWERDGDALKRTFTFPDFSRALAFVVEIGLRAEKHDHHPDIELGWGRVRVSWSTHDPKGTTKLDLELAEATEKVFDVR